MDYASGTSSFGYDAADRLTSASGGPHAGAGYAYDANGNKTSVTVAGANYGATVDPSSNRILTFTAPGVARSYSYDNKGNTVGDGTRTYSWSNTNKLLSATNGTTTAYYGYNGFGQRVKKVVGQAARYYFYDDDGYSLLGEYFQTTPGAPVGTVYETVYLEGIPVAVLKGSSIYYIQPDHLNTPRIIRDASGVLVWKWDSDLYGKGLANQNPGGVSLFEFNIRFPGQVFDAETGLHYNMARYYDPEIGRYTSSDPIGLGGGINTYEYVAGNPTGAVDPKGTWFFIPALVESGISLLVTRVVPAVILAYSTGKVGSIQELFSTYFNAPSWDYSNEAKLDLQNVLSRRQPGQEIFLTYTRRDACGNVYSGRTSGTGSVEDIMRDLRNSRRHRRKTQAGFGDFVIDRISTDKQAIIGREQMLMNHYGGAISSGGVSLNMRNEIAVGAICDFLIQKATAEFGPLQDRSPVTNKNYCH